MVLNPFSNPKCVHEISRRKRIFIFGVDFRWSHLREYMYKVVAYLWKRVSESGYSLVVVLIRQVELHGGSHGVPEVITDHGQDPEEDGIEHNLTDDGVHLHFLDTFFLSLFQDARVWWFVVNFTWSYIQHCKLINVISTYLFFIFYLPQIFVHIYINVLYFIYVYRDCNLSEIKLISLKCDVKICINENIEFKNGNRLRESVDIYNCLDTIFITFVVEYGRFRVPTICPHRIPHFLNFIISNWLSLTNPLQSLHHDHK